MAGRSKFIIAHPNNEDHEIDHKGGKSPKWATWVLFTEENPHHTEGAGWVRGGWSFIADENEARKKALPDMRKQGLKVTVTRVLPTV